MIAMNIIENTKVIPNEFKNIFCFAQCIYDSTYSVVHYLHTMDYLQEKFKLYITESDDFIDYEYSQHDLEKIEKYEYKYCYALNEYEKRIVAISYNLFYNFISCKEHVRIIEKYIGDWSKVKSDYTWNSGLHILLYDNLKRFCNNEKNIEFCKPYHRSKKLMSIK